MIFSVKMFYPKNSYMPQTYNPKLFTFFSQKSTNYSRPLQIPPRIFKIFFFSLRLSKKIFLKKKLSTNFFFPNFSFLSPPTYFHYAKLSIPLTLDDFVLRRRKREDSSTKFGLCIKIYSSRK